MSGELAVVRGTVIGDENAPVAGWVSLGKKSPQRWLSHVVRIRTDDGREITLEDLSADTIVPVEVEDTKWREIEGSELAKLCVREAPAPDVEVDFTTALLRGGAPIVAWGVATDHGPAGGSSDAFRGTAERAITKLSARVIATGYDREALLERTRDKLVDKARAEEAKRERKPAEEKKKNKPAVSAKPKRDPDYTNRIARNLPLWLALGGFAVVAAFALAGTAYGHLLRITAIFALAPIAFDAIFVPRFRNGAIARPSLEVPFVGFLLAAVGVGITSYGLVMKDVEASRAKGVYIASIVLAAIAFAAFAWLWLATRSRRQYIAMMVSAPPQPHPLRDGVWGAVDGAFSSEVLSIGENVHVWGAAVKDSAGIKQRNVSTQAFANVSIEGTLRTEESAHTVRLAEAAILTMAKLERATGVDRGVRADVINARTPVRVVGRATDGTFVKGGEASLLVFAGGVETDVVRELRRLHVRHVVANVLAGAGVVAFVGSFVV